MKTTTREPGWINENTLLVDAGMSGAARVLGVYLVKGDKTCLIDSGTREGVARLIKALDAEKAFPPDYVLLTHPHWDHAQGVPGLRKAAERRGCSPVDVNKCSNPARLDVNTCWSSYSAA